MNPLRSSLDFCNRLPLWRLETRVWGRTMWSPTFDRWLYLVLHKLGRMGGDEKDFLRSRVRPGMTVLDVGANIGLYTLELSRLVGGTGQVHAFEPDPVIFEALRRNVERNGATNVHVHNSAAGSEPGTLHLRRTLLNSGDNRISPDAGSGDPDMVPVEVVRVDDVLGGTPVDFIKIDVQGWEYEAFKGMRRTVAGSPGLSLLFEFWPYGLRGAGCDPVMLLEFVKALPMELSAVEGMELTPIENNEQFAAQVTGRRFVNLLGISRKS